MGDTEMFLAVALSAIITFLLRALPFMVFRKGNKMPEKLTRLGNKLPSAIMAVLIVYCLKNVTADFGTYGIAEGVAVFLVAVSYKWKKSTLLSIVLGTACNMILMHVI